MPSRVVVLPCKSNGGPKRQHQFVIGTRPTWSLYVYRDGVSRTNPIQVLFFKYVIGFERLDHVVTAAKFRARRDVRNHSMLVEDFFFVLDILQYFITAGSSNRRCAYAGPTNSGCVCLSSRAAGNVSPSHPVARMGRCWYDQRKLTSTFNVDSITVAYCKRHI